MTIAALTQKLSIATLGTLIALVAMNNTAQAATFREGRGDVAGETLDTALDLGGDINQISGRLNNGRDADLFSFLFLGGDFRARVTNATDPDIDTQLFLFDENGMGIVANDDRRRPNNPNGPTLRSRVAVDDLARGQYFLGISSYDNDPLSEDGPIFVNQVYGQARPTDLGGASPLIGFEGDRGDRGQYEISISQTAQSVPEPASLMGLMAIAGAGATLTKRRAAKSSLT